MEASSRKPAEGQLSLEVKEESIAEEKRTRAVSLLTLGCSQGKSVSDIIQTSLQSCLNYSIVPEFPYELQHLLKTSGMRSSQGAPLCPP